MHRFVVSLLVLLGAFGCESEAKLGNIDDPNIVDTGGPSEELGDDEAVIGTAACPVHYEVIALGPLHGGDSAGGYGINDKGWVHGASHTYIEWVHGSVDFIWKPNTDDFSIGEIVEFNDESGWGGARIDAINNDGDVSGTTVVEHPNGFDWVSRPYYWTEDDGVQLMVEAGDEAMGHSEVKGMNNNGVVVGVGLKVDMGTYEVGSGYYCTLDDGYTQLPFPEALQEGGNLRAVDINDKGQILGQGKMLDYLRDATFIWSESEGYKLLKGYGPLGYERIYPNKINNRGEVVGSATPYVDGEPWGSSSIVWDSRGYPKDLGLLTEPEYIDSGDAADINDHGLIVGTDMGGRETYGWVYCDGKKHALDKMLAKDAGELHISWVAGVNNNGQIVANGSGGPFFLHPYFEPGEEPE